jgi:hypothetical protein
VRSEICDLVLRSVSNQTGLVACLDEAAGRLWVRRDKLGALKGLISWACGLMWCTPPPPAMVSSPSSSPELTEDRNDVVTVNRV